MLELLSAYSQSQWTFPTDGYATLALQWFVRSLDRVVRCATWKEDTGHDSIRIAIAITALDIPLRRTYEPLFPTPRIGAHSDLPWHTLPFVLLRRFISGHKELLCPNTVYQTPRTFAPRGDTYEASMGTASDSGTIYICTLSLGTPVLSRQLLCFFVYTSFGGEIPNNPFTAMWHAESHQCLDGVANPGVHLWPSR